MMHVGGYHEYRGGCSVPWGTQITKDFFRTSQLRAFGIISQRCSLNRLAQLNLNTKQSFYEKRAKSLEEFFLQLWKSDFDDLLQITGNKYI